MAAVDSVLIVGGGIAGMTLAVGLGRAGIRSEIVEVNPDWSVIGVGISMQGHALRALKALGLLDPLVARGFGYSFFKACDAEGNVTGTVDLPRLSGPEYPATMGVMRQALHDVLKEGVERCRVPVRLGVTVDALAEAGTGIEARLSDGSTGRYGLVVGADGAYSRVRALLFGEDVIAPYTGQAIWRATVSRPPEVEARYSYFGPRHKAGFNPVSKDRMYIYLVQNLPEWTRIPDDRLPATMREILADFGGLMAAAREEVTDPEQIVYRPITSLILPAPWYCGRALLIGDAAHTTTPQMASGAALAIEDSVVLSELLQEDRPLPEILDAFMARRFERCRMTVESSFRLGEWEKTPDDPEADPVGVFGRAVRALAQPF